MAMGYLGMSTPRLSFTSLLPLVTITPSLSDLNLSSTSLGAPDVETILLESGDGAGLFSAKGIGL
jgi:hypothetical protein